MASGVYEIWSTNSIKDAAMQELRRGRGDGQYLFCRDSGECDSSGGSVEKKRAKSDHSTYPWRTRNHMPVSQACFFWYQQWCHGSSLRTACKLASSAELKVFKRPCFSIKGLVSFNTPTQHKTPTRHIIPTQDSIYQSHHSNILPIMKLSPPSSSFSVLQQLFLCTP